ncbi:MAG: protein kinase domain-containing protein [Chloroflexota bacterium]
MNNLKLANGNALSLGAKIGGGGEGSVYAVPHTPDYVAKIYIHSRRTPQLAQKLSMMVANQPDDPTRTTLKHVSIAWPSDLIYENKKVVGFVMPKMGKSNRLYELIQPQLRAKQHPTLSYKYNYRVAANLAQAMASIHAKNYVIGDVNEHNALFNDQALITIIDCDSMQVIDTQTNTVFPCLVGVPEMTAPELQGVDFSKSANARTQDSDVFALAIIIFKLLMEGFHPFQGVAVGKEPNREQAHVYCIQHQIFPYLSGQRYMPPPVAPGFLTLPAVLRQLFVRTFVEKNRPSAQEWAKALTMVERRLATCPHDSAHVYPHDGYCAVCEVQFNAKRRPRTTSAPERTEQRIVFTQTPLISATTPKSASPVQPQAIPTRATPVAPTPTRNPQPNTKPVTTRSNTTLPAPSQSSNTTISAPPSVTRSGPPVLSVKAIVASAKYSMALCTDGSVRLWGARDYTNIPAGVQQIVAIAAGPQAAYAVRSDGCVFTWGPNPPTVLAQLSDVNNIAVGSSDVLLLHASGKVSIVNAHQQVQSQALANITQIAMGHRHFVTMDVTGAIRAWGDNSQRQTDISPDITNVSRIVAGGSATGFVRANGALAIIGGPANLTAIPGAARQVTDVTLTNQYVLAIRKDQTIVGWGNTANRVLQIPFEVAQAKLIAVAGSDDHALAIDTRGKVYAWGADSYGQIAVPADIAAL